MKKKAMVLLLSMLMLLTACGSNIDKYETNTLLLKSDSIQDISVEDYTGVDVTKKAVQAYVEEQIAAYQNSGAVVLDELTMNNQIVRLSLTYDSIDTYNAVNKTEYSLVPAKDWKHKAEDLKTMVSPESGALDEEAVEALLTEDAKVLVLSQKTDVVISGTILAYAGGEYDGDTVVHADEGTIIIYR